MKIRLLFGLLFYALLPVVHAASYSPVTTAEEDRTRYMEFLEEHSKAQVCVVQLADFREKFPALLRKWKVRNESVMRTGDAFVRAEARLDEITIEEKVERATRTAVDKLKAMSEGDLQKACDDILKWFGPDGPYSGKPPEAPKPVPAAAPTPQAG
jgi:hypothetical protein